MAQSKPRPENRFKQLSEFQLIPWTVYIQMSQLRLPHEVATLSEQKSYARRGISLLLHRAQRTSGRQKCSCILITNHDQLQDGGSLGVRKEVMQEPLEVKRKSMGPMATSGLSSGFMFVFSVIIYFFEPRFLHL